MSFQKQSKKTNKKQSVVAIRGFTLVELLVVIGIGLTL